MRIDASCGHRGQRCKPPLCKHASYFFITILIAARRLCLLSFSNENISCSLTFPCAASFLTLPHLTLTLTLPLQYFHMHLPNQYIGMELCEHGDAEVFIKAQRDGLLPTVEAQAFLFQMAFALYAGRAELSLRHFDVKLLNFFVSDASRLVGGGQGGGEGLGNVEEGGPVTLRYGVGGDVVELCLPQDRAYLVSGAWVGYKAEFCAVVSCVPLFFYMLVLALFCLGSPAVDVCALRNAWILSNSTTQVIFGRVTCFSYCLVVLIGCSFSML